MKEKVKYSWEIGGMPMSMDRINILSLHVFLVAEVPDRAFIMHYHCQLSYVHVDSFTCLKLKLGYLHLDSFQFLPFEEIKTPNF